MSLPRLEQIIAGSTPGPWYPFHVDDDYAMNCYGVSTDPDFERNEDYLTGSDKDDATCRRTVALTLYQSKRVVCHQAGRWHEDAELIALAPVLAQAVIDAEAKLAAALLWIKQEQEANAAGLPTAPVPVLVAQLLNDGLSALRTVAGVPA